VREIKFRVFVDRGHIKDSYFHYFSSLECMIDWYHGSLSSERYDEINSAQQYTGLKDKNGKEIYEGDICRLTDEHWSEQILIGEVKYSNGTFYITNSPEEYNWDPDTELEVIGNIYENPEFNCYR
jgi:uncharacterized phage protein (TIGR01671 family)